MASKSKNMANLFRDARSRTIILVTLFILILATLMGYLSFRSRTKGEVQEAAATRLAGAPRSIRSIPGSIDPTEQYAKLQEKQNIAQARRAERTGRSAIPTIIRVEKFGEGKELKRPAGAQEGVGFTTLSRLQEGGAQQTLWFQNLKDSKCAKKELAIAKQQNATIGVLRAAGCSARKLLAADFNLAELKAGGFSAGDLRKAGFSANQLKAVGFNATQLRDAGYSACDLKNAGFTAKEMKAAGYTDGELRGAGFSPEELKGISGLPPGWTPDRIRKNGCSVEALKQARAAGVSAAAIRRYAGCTAAQLRAAGYTAKELRDAGFTAKQLKDAGFSAEQLKNAGFDAKELKNVGFTAEQLKAAGFDAKDLKDAGFNSQELKNAGFSADDLKHAGFTANQLREAGYSAKQLKNAGFTAGQLKNAGYDDDEIRSAGYSPTALRAAGIIKPAAAVGPAGETDAQLKRILARQAAQVSEQRLQRKIDKLQNSISGEMIKLVKGWESPNQVFTAGKEQKKEKVAGTTGTTGATGTGTGATGTTATGGGVAPGQPMLIKAGTIYFAVMDTSVNSDEPGPVLATIISGRFKGAKLVGSLQPTATGGATRPQKVILTFNIMTVPGAPQSMGINAFAIDPNTARTALSSKTNDHFFLRYGSLLASSFMEGIGEAFKSEGTSVTVNGGSTTVAQADRSDSDNITVAFGKVGEKWGEEVKKNFERPPTIRVFSGTGIGILFTRDVPPPIA